MSDTVFIFCAGPFYGLVETPQPGDRILAADGGYRHCQALGLQPELLLGDFDSLGKPPEDLPVETYPVEKDDPDSMLAVRLGLKLGCKVFHLYGATGGRMDHTLANCQILGYLAQQGARGYLYDEGYVFTAIGSGGTLTLPPRQEGIFSVFCLGDTAKGVSIRGGYYPLDHGDLLPTVPLGLSNHFQGQPVEISVEEGCLLIGWELPSAP